MSDCVYLKVEVKDNLFRGFPVLFYTYSPEIGRCTIRYSTYVWSGSPNVFWSAMVRVPVAFGEGWADMKKFALCSTAAIGT